MDNLSPLIIEATKSTPAVMGHPTPNRLKLAGQSYPENASKFYDPIFSWVDQLLSNLDKHDTLTIEIDLCYINTSSSKCIMMLLDKFEYAYEQGKLLKLNWYYDLENESELECAEEFKEDFTFPFTIIGKEKIK